MKILKEILPEKSGYEIRGEDGIEIMDVTIDSRKVEKDSLFIAQKGMTVDGHSYIEKAIERGASCVVCQDWPARFFDQVVYVRVENSKEAITEICQAFFESPSTAMDLIGITGTNGKTTTATLLFDLCRSIGEHVGLISTVENRINEEVLVSTHTTPDIVSVYRLLHKMKERGCKRVFMEVSSHAIDQGRISGLNFRGGVFTNISHDHLNYHKTFKNYINTKKKFFDELSKKSFALTNADDRNGSVMVQNTSAKVSNYSMQTIVEYRAKMISNSLEGLQLEIDSHEFHSSLVGRFNAYNLLVTYAVARLLGMETGLILQHLSSLKPAEGRFDIIKHPLKKRYAIVDYAHTPDALQNVLEVLNDICGKSKVLTVVGAGGDRDKSKRPKMAVIAAQYSREVILSSDNPRSEDPELILDDMEEGLNELDAKNYVRITDRKQAIRTAVRLVRDGDIILVAGKGHEKYQEIKGEKFPFDDKEILLTAFAEDT